MDNVTFELNAFCVMDKSNFNPTTVQQAQQEIQDALEGIGIKAEVTVSNWYCEC